MGALPRNAPKKPEAMINPSLSKFDSLIHDIYAAALKPDTWAEIVGGIADALGAEKGILFTPQLVPDRGGFIFPHGISWSHIELWGTRYQSDDLWLQKVVERNCLYQGSIVIGHELVDDEELLASRWYREFLSRVDIFHLMSGALFGVEHESYPLVGCSLFRGRQAVHFGEHCRQRFRILLPHLSRSLELMFRLRDAEFRVAASLQALNQIRSGILLLDDAGAVCFANTTAEAILRREDGLGLKTQRGSLGLLHSHDLEAQPVLEHILRAAVRISEGAVDHFAHAVAVRRSAGSDHYSVQVACLPESNPYLLDGKVPRAIVFIKDTGQSLRPDGGLLQRVYNLTRTEVRVALAVCDGSSLDQVALHLNVKMNTLKTHLKSIYAKMAVNNRAALFRLMSSLAQ